MVSPGSHWQLNTLADSGPKQWLACLKWNKKGASSALQFGLGCTKIDPGFVALLDTALTFRLHCVPDVAFPVLSGLAHCPPRHFDPGPCGVFLSRLHDIQWSWDDNGFIIDHEGLSVHLLDSPIQYLKLRLRQAWERQVGFAKTYLQLRCSVRVD